MAVIQIAKIQVRRGLQENLPNLDAGEFGWSTDTLRLYIGNGSTGDPDYAPVPGNTEVLTVYSSLSEIAMLSANVDILLSNVSTLQSNVSTLLTRTAITTINLYANASVATNIGDLRLSSLGTNIIDYSIIRGSTSRVGTIRVTQLTGNVIYEDDFSESANTGIILSYIGDGVTFANLAYTNQASAAATLTYYLKSFS
jgi:hypothetical protein